MNAPPRIGILGIGQRGLQHLAALWRLQEMGLVRIAALGDAHEPNLEEAKIRRFVPGYRQESIRRYAAFDALLASAELDALYVCIPPNLHNGEVIAAAARGLHLFVEKPMSLDLAEAQAMNAAIDRSGVISAVGFQERYDAWHTAMRDYLRGKRLVMATMVRAGNVESHAVKHTPTEALGGPASRIWTAYQAWSGNTVVEAGIHQTDLLRYWCGEIDAVQARYVPRPPDLVETEGDNPLAYSVAYTFANGAVGHLIMSRLARVFHQETYLHVLWDHGHLGLEASGPVAYFHDGAYPPATPPAPDALRHPLPVGARGDPTLEASRAFAQAVSQADPSLIRSPFADALRSLAAVLGANVSAARNGERVSIPELLHDARAGEQD